MKSGREKFGAAVALGLLASCGQGGREAQDFDSVEYFQLCTEDVEDVSIDSANIADALNRADGFARVDYEEDGMPRSGFGILLSSRENRGGRETIRGQVGLMNNCSSFDIDAARPMVREGERRDTLDQIAEATGDDA